MEGWRVRFLFFSVRFCASKANRPTYAVLNSRIRGEYEKFLLLVPAGLGLKEF